MTNKWFSSSQVKKLSGNMRIYLLRFHVWIVRKWWLGDFLERKSSLLLRLSHRWDCIIHIPFSRFSCSLRLLGWGLLLSFWRSWSWNLWRRCLFTSSGLSFICCLWCWRCNSLSLSWHYDCYLRRRSNRHCTYHEMWNIRLPICSHVS